jgi:hypothetical protein
MRGQVILLTALIIAMAVSAVLILQSVATSAPGFGGVRAAYGVFSRDVSKAVEAITSYLDYVGAVSLINFTENTALYALPAVGFDVKGEPVEYCKWLHVNKTADMVNASMMFFVVNRAPLGLSVELPQRPQPADSCKTLEFRGGDRTIVRLNVTGLPNGTLLVTPQAENYDNGLKRQVEQFSLVLPKSSVALSYRASMVMDVSLLALAGLNVTREFNVSARVLGVDVNCPAGGVCVNITVSRPYMWTAKFEVLNRTIYDEEGKLYINYSLLSNNAGIDVDLVNYTEYSAVYLIKPEGLPEGRLVEYVIKAYVANIPIYLAPAAAVNPQAACQGSELRNNGWDVPIVLANFTKVNILDSSTSYRNVTKINYNIYNQEVTYWVIHRNGKIVFNSNNVCSGDVKQNLRNRGLYWVYP